MRRTWWYRRFLISAERLQGLASADKGVTFSQVTQLFNGTLKGALQQSGLLSKVIYVDAYTWVDGIQANFQANGFTVSNTGTACNLAAMTAAATKLGEPNPSRIRHVAVLLAANLHGGRRGPDVYVRRYGPPDDASARTVLHVRGAADCCERAGEIRRLDRDKRMK